MTAPSPGYRYPRSHIESSPRHGPDFGFVMVSTFWFRQHALSRPVIGQSAGALRFPLRKSGAPRLNPAPAVWVAKAAR